MPAVKMMTDPNSSAVPCIVPVDLDFHQRNSIELGLTKREYFAAMAMQGLLANSSLQEWSEPEAETACEAVEQSDALIAALNKRTEREEG